VVIRALVAALAALALLPATASAHALLKATIPERGARLDAVPGQVSLRFSEPVEAEFGAVRVFDSRGREVQQGRTFHPGGRSSEVAVRLHGGLGEDGYTATYRVISADSHPVSGGFVFVVGNAAAPGTTVAELLGDDDAGPVTGTAFGAVRAVQFASIALALGTLLFALVCWLPGLRAAAGGGASWAAASAAFAARARMLLLGAAAAGALSAAVALVLQGAVAGGTPVWQALSAPVIGDVLGTRFGLFWALGVVAWLLVSALTLARPGAVPVLRPASVGATGLALPGRTRLTALAVPLAALALLPALGGHAGVQSPVAVLLPANVLHVVAMSAWLGGIAVLVLAVRAATARLDAGARTRLLAAVVGRFSALAGVAIAVLLASGLAQGIVEVRTAGNLVETAFGRAILVKIALFAGIVGVGAVNRRRLLPALARAARAGAGPGRTGRLLRRTLRAELVLGAAAIAVTGALAGYAPSIAESTGPYSTSADIGPARLEMTVDPARVGPNEVHVYLFDRRTGRQFDATKELTVTAALAEKRIAPIRLHAVKAGPGHYVVSGATLGIAGEWMIEIASRVSDFDEHRVHIEVPIR
jgi:copper transport protein